MLITMAGSWALARFSFEVPFNPAVGPVLLVYLIITALNWNFSNTHQLP